jgi:tetratricopeptide (TPR) repeat protein
VQQEPSQPQNPTGQQRKKLHAKRPSKAAAANPFFSPTPTFPQQAIFGGDSAMLPRRQQPNSAERAAAAATSAKLFVDSPTSHPNTPADSNNANPPPSEKHTCARTRRCESNTPYTTTDGGSNGFNFRVDLKPEEKKMVGRGRAFRRGLKQDFGVPIHHTNTEDTASSTDNSPSSTSTGDMSFMHFASPPPAPAPAGTQAYWQPQPPHAQAPFVSVHQPVYPSAPPAEGTVQFNIGAASAKPKKNQGRKLSAVERQRQANLEQQRILEDKISKVMVYRDSAKMLYKSGDYCKCIMACTTGVDLYQKELAGVPNTNLLGVLYSNRAAALLMVGAYQAAVDDCSEALQFTSYSSNPGQLVECPPSMIPKLYNRRARARGKMGDIDGADADFHAAIAKATELLAKIQQSGGNAEFLESLNRETIDATNGQMTVMSCRTAWNKARALCNNVTRLCSEQSLDAIEDVNNALSFCSGCSDLQEMKIKLLAHLKRWRELLRYCERIGADKVKMDGCFPGDLELKNPLPGVDHARHLKSTLFDGISDDDVAGVFFRLNYKAKAEVVLRLPYLARPAYVKGLRLQEDYIGAKECIARLEIYLDSKPGLRACFTWLAHEKELISRTESLRSNADFLFGSGKFDEAADEYYKISCLDRNAGGRLNAVMHCNRAACFMAVHKLNEALNECNRALQLHPRYMKALLRRARCHTRLDRYDEAIADYQRYLDYVQKAMDGDTSFIRVSPMVFDGPSSVSQESIKSVRDALDEAQKLKRDKQADDDRRRTEYAQRQWRSERFNGDAQRRRENFYQSSSRPWDSFANRGPRRSPQFSQNDNTRNASNRGGNANQANNADRASQNQNQRNRQQQTSRSPRHVKDFYEVLQISYQATQADIKKAYRKLALKHHPDKSDDPNAADNFRRIQEAFEKLKDEESRRHYDRERRRGY